jgi:hypothetical protein
MMKDKTKKESAPARGRLRKPPALIAAAALALAAAILIALVQNRPRYTWYVEEGLEAAWGRVLREAGAPAAFKDGMTVVKPGEGPPENAAGFFITTRRARSSGPVTVYPGLSFELEHEGAYVLALDPWMIFRDYRQPALGRSRIEAVRGGTGKLLLPGHDEESIRAWTAQLVRDSQGAFPGDRSIWDTARASLFSNERFYRGSITLNWQDAWFFLSENEAAWVYAPLSRIRELPNFRSSLLEASVFPAPGDGTGLQARILWAIPLGDAKTIERLKRSPLAWLKDPAHQTIMADILEWLPADPDGEPYNPAAMAAKRAWLTASYVWELNG